MPTIGNPLSKNMKISDAAEVFSNKRNKILGKAKAN